jgi:DNA-binding NtrC family response regulator
MLILFTGKRIEVENLPQEMRRFQQPETAPLSAAFRLPEQGLNMDDLEADLIKQALGRALGNRSKAARLLGLTRDTLLYRMKKYAIES